MANDPKPSRSYKNFHWNVATPEINQSEQRDSTITKE